ncbi:MAG: diguanylate cyclase [Nitrospirae bacterium]|nr:diguanylate cyclase [Nitrospirota bacterium]
MKILVADNSEESRTTLSKILTDKGHECVLLENSAEIISTVYHEAPDIIILDLKLSKPPALSVLQQLKSAPSTRDIPTLLIASTKSKIKLGKGYDYGAYDYLSKPFFEKEVVARLQNIIEIRERLKEFEKLLVRDYLTGLYNRKFFMERFIEELSWSIMYSEQFSLMVLDIDHFKKINDTYGHGCGDEILKQVADTMLATLRAQDLLARYGGEEFIILLPNTGIESAVEIGESLRKAVQEHDFRCNQDLKIAVTISIGITSLSDDEPTSDHIIGQADKALYRAKETGRNKVVVY